MALVLRFRRLPAFAQGRRPDRSLRPFVLCRRRSRSRRGIRLLPFLTSRNRFESLVRGKLYLSLENAVALALRIISISKWSGTHSRWLRRTCCGHNRRTLRRDSNAGGAEVTAEATSVPAWLHLNVRQGGNCEFTTSKSTKRKSSRIESAGPLPVTAENNN